MKQIEGVQKEVYDEEQKKERKKRIKSDKD